MANLVKSVQHFSLSTTGASVAGSLATGTDHTQCVPFAMATAGDTLSNFGDSLIGVAMSSGNVTVTRTDTTGTLLAEVYVVEFDSAVTVQQGTYTIADTSTSTTASLSAVTLADSWVLSYGVIGSDTRTSANTIRTHFNSTTQLGFNRSGTTGAHTGQWYVAEHSNFDTQEFEAVSMTGASTTSSPSSYTVANSFLVADTTYSGTNKGPDDCAVNATMTNGTTITYTRVATPNTHTIDCHLVECNDGDFVSQSGLHDMNNQGTSDTDTLSPGSNLNRSAAFAALRTPYGSNAADSTNGTQSAGVCRMELTDTTELTIYKAKATTAGTANVSWQVVEWAIANSHAAGMMGCNF
jgi:hypothetical protein